MIRLSAGPSPAGRGAGLWIHRIFAEQPYLANVYPRNTREIGLVFAIPGRGDPVLPPGVSPIFRATYAFGGSPIHPKGYEITEDCLACGLCLAPAPRAASSRGGLCDPAGTLPPLRQCLDTARQGGPPRTAATQD